MINQVTPLVQRAILDDRRRRADRPIAARTTRAWRRTGPEARS